VKSAYYNRSFILIDYRNVICTSAYAHFYCIYEHMQHNIDVVT